MQGHRLHRPTTHTPWTCVHLLAAHRRSTHRCNVGRARQRLHGTTQALPESNSSPDPAAQCSSAAPSGSTDHAGSAAASRHRSQAVRFPYRQTQRSSRTAKCYLTVPVDVEDVGFVDFILDSGSTGIMITAHLRDQLGLASSDGQATRGLGSSGMTLRQRVTLPGLHLGPRALDATEGYVTDLKLQSEQALGGVLGMRILSSFEIEIDPAAGVLAFHPPGHIQQGVLEVTRATEVRCSTLTKGGLKSVSVSLAGGPFMPAILDLGANYSTINWAAATQLEQCLGALIADQVPVPDGLPTAVVRSPVSVSLGDPARRPAHTVARCSPMLVRDVPIFSMLGLSGSPAMVLGRDLVGAHRTVLDLGSDTLWLEAPP